MEQLRQEMPDLVAQLEEAVTTGGDVVIPTGTFAAKIAGTPLRAALEPHLRSNPEAMSLHEADLFRQNSRERLAAAMRGSEEDTAAAAATIRSGDQVEASLEQ